MKNLPVWTASLRTNHKAFILPLGAPLLIGFSLLAGCSALPTGPTQPTGAAPQETVIYQTAAIPGGGLQLTEAYPAPDSALIPTPGLPKAVTPDPETLPLFLPVIYNERVRVYPFAVQGSGALAIQGFSGCGWEGVAGQIFDLAGAPLKNLVLHLEGVWAGQPIAREALSGSSDKYGPAGYEFVLGSQTLDSSQSLWIQVRDATGKEISARVFFDTFNDCARNLILVNFNQIQ